jgi:hypothetical protein
VEVEGGERVEEEEGEAWSVGRKASSATDGEEREEVDVGAWRSMGVEEEVGIWKAGWEDGDGSATTVGASAS